MRHPPLNLGACSYSSHWLSALVDTIFLWSKRAIQRRHLARLDFRMRQDVGLDPTAIEQEVIKPFWRM